MRTSNIIDILCNGRNRRPADREMPSQSGRGPRNQHVNITPVIRITNWKKSVYTITGCLLAVLAAVSCAKDDDTVTLHAVIADRPSGGSKVFVDDDNYACWQNGDAVKINGDQYSVVVEPGDKRAATISGVTKNESGGYTAAYPAAYVQSCFNKTVTLTMPSTQTFSSDADGQNIVAPMAGYTDDPTPEAPLRFHNVAGVLKVNVKNSLSKDLNIYALEIESSNAYIAGTGTVEGVDTPTPSLTISSDKTKKVMLMCNNTLLNAEDSADFYLVVAPFADPTQFTVHVLATGATDNLKYTFHRESKSGITIARNQIGSISVNVNSTYTHTGDEGNYFWGQGTPKCPFIIATKGELDTLKLLVNHEGSGLSYDDTRYNTESVYYRQVVNISYGGSLEIGKNTTYQFRANYNGNGHSITGLTSAVFQYAGGTSEQTKIENLTASGTNNNTATSTHYNRGGIINIIPSSSSIIINQCTTAISINNSSYYNDGYKYGYGGIVGNGEGTYTISDCKSSGNIYTISSSTSYRGRSNYGGIIGRAAGNGTITNCTNYGEIGTDPSNTSNHAYRSACSGGIVGRIAGSCTISNCTNNGSINHCGNEVAYNSGGICGRVATNTSGTEGAVSGWRIENCINNGDVIGISGSAGNNSVCGGILGGTYGANSGSIFNCCNTGKVEFQGTETNTTINCGGIIGWICVNSSAAAQTTIDKCYNTGYVKSALNTSTGYAGGIVGYDYTNASGQLHITNCFSNASIDGGRCAGGIVGNNYNSALWIENCYSFGQISVSNEPSSGDDKSKYAKVGGIIGSNGNRNSDRPIITNCYSTCTFSSSSSYTHTGTIAGQISLGNNINNCYGQEFFPTIPCCGTILNGGTPTYCTFTNYGKISSDDSGLLKALNRTADNQSYFCHWRQEANEYPKFDWQ